MHTWSLESVDVVGLVHIGFIRLPHKCTLWVALQSPPWARAELFFVFCDLASNLAAPSGV